MRIILDKGNRMPIKSWCMKPEIGALQQTANLVDIMEEFTPLAVVKG